MLHLPHPSHDVLGYLERSQTTTLLGHFNETKNRIPMCLLRGFTASQKERPKEPGTGVVHRYIKRPQSGYSPFQPETPGLPDALRGSVCRTRSPERHSVPEGYGCTLTAFLPTALNHLPDVRMSVQRFPSGHFAPAEDSTLSKEW